MTPFFQGELVEVPHHSQICAVLLPKGNRVTLERPNFDREENVDAGVQQITGKLQHVTVGINFQETDLVLIQLVADFPISRCNALCKHFRAYQRPVYSAHVLPAVGQVHLQSRQDLVDGPARKICDRHDDITKDITCIVNQVGHVLQTHPVPQPTHQRTDRKTGGAIGFGESSDHDVSVRCKAGRIGQQSSFILVPIGSILEGVS